MNNSASIFRTFLCILLFAALLAASTTPVRAQGRTMDGDLFVSAAGAVSSTWPSWGGSLSAGMYFIPGCAALEVNALMRTASLSSGGDMSFLHLTAGPSWMFRLVSSRSRSVSLYAGAFAFVGWERFDPLGSLPQDILFPEGVSESSLLAGLGPVASLEWFLSGAFALRLSARVPVSIASGNASRFFVDGTLGFLVEF